MHLFRPAHAGTITVAAPIWNYSGFDSTIQARELLAAYHHYDKCREKVIAGWMFQSLPIFRKVYRQWRLNLIEARSNVIFYGGNP